MAANKQTQDFLDSIISAHGGLDRWRRVDKIEVSYNFHGGVLELKGHTSYQPQWTLNAQGDLYAVGTNYGKGDHRDRYHVKSDRVWVESPDGQLKQDRPDPRSAFRDHTYTSPWDDLHLSYFIGYATYNYLTIPWLFVRPGFETVELEPHVENNQTWRVLQVTYPDGVATHSKVQKFYFGAEDFLLRRMDYRADVLQGFAAHYVFDYKNIDGLLLPTQRRAVRRVDDVPQPNQQTAFWLNYTAVKFIDQDGTAHTEAKRVIT